MKRIFYFLTNIIYLIQSFFSYTLFSNSKTNYLLFVYIFSKGKGNKVNLKEKSEIFKTKFNLYGKQNLVYLGTKTKVKNSKFILKGNNNIVSIDDECNLKNLIVVLEGNNNKLKIGSFTTNSGDTEIYVKEGSNLEIGRDCMISRNIIIRTSDGHSVINTQTKKRINFAEDVRIKNHVWISQNVTILKGTYIESDSIVATGAIVNKKFSDKGSILAGIPAKKINSGVTWDRDLL